MSRKIHPVIGIMITAIALSLFIGTPFASASSAKEHGAKETPAKAETSKEKETVKKASEDGFKKNDSAVQPKAEKKAEVKTDKKAVKKSEKKTAAVHDSKDQGHGSGHHAVGMSAEKALAKLLEGNTRYVDGKTSAPNRSKERRSEVAKGQHPFAVVLGCSDSRVPPELLFDAGFGDLFVVRTAGNIADSVALGSIEYAVEHLGSKLVVVLGHERCGAVDATVKGGDTPANIKNVCNMIRPAVDKARDKHPEDLLEASVKSNVKMVAEHLRTSPIIGEMIQDGVVKIVGAYYDLDTGAVDVIFNPCMLISLPAAQPSHQAAAAAHAH